MTNNDQAIELIVRLEGLKAVMEELKRAFSGDALEGGWKAALTHPLYLSAEAEIADIREQLKGLI